MVKATGAPTESASQFKNLLRSRTGLVLLLSIPAFIVLIGNYAVYTALHYGPVDAPRYWPVSIFTPTPLSWRAVVSALVAVLLGFLLIRITPFLRKSWQVVLVILAGLTLLIASNAIQGRMGGIEQPVNGDAGGIGVQYFHDTPKVAGLGVKRFIRHYAEFQWTLHTHAQTHPPFPVLLYYELGRFFSVIGISLFLAAATTTLSGLFLFGILRERVALPIALRLTLLYLLIPAIQVYYLSSVDAAITTSLLGLLYAVLVPKHRTLSVLLGGGFLLAAQSLTFLAVFAVPVLFLAGLWRREWLWRIVGVSAIALIAWWALYRLSGFNYFQSFQVAQTLEKEVNTLPEFRTVMSYIFSRFEDVGEILLFFSPALVTALFLGLRRRLMLKRDWIMVAGSAIAVFVLMLLVGVYRTGETARGANFLYPFLFLGAADLVAESGLSDRDWYVLYGLVFGQVIIMQLVGNYFW